MMPRDVKDSTFVGLMSGTFKLFRWSGHWFPFSNPKSNLLLNSDLYRSFLFIITIPLQFIPCAIDLIMKIPDVSKVIMNAISTVYVMHAFFRVIFTIVMGNRIWHIFNELDRCVVPGAFRTIDAKLGENATRNAFRLANKIFLLIIFGANFTGCLFTVTPFAISYEARAQKVQESYHTNGSLPNVLVYEAWYPFDVSHFPAYQITVALQAFSGFIWINMISTSDAVYLAVVVRTVEELDVLQNMLRIMSNVKLTEINDDDRNRSVSSTKRSDEIVWPRDANTLLRSWIGHHQLVLGIIKEIKETFSVFVFGVIGCNFVSLALLAYVGARIKDLTALLSIIGFLFVVTTQLFSFSYYSQKLTSKAEELSKELLWVKWWETSKEFRTTLKIICLKASEETVITGMNFFDLDLELFVAGVKGAISYFMVLIQVTEGTE